MAKGHSNKDGAWEFQILPRVVFFSTQGKTWSSKLKNKTEQNKTLHVRMEREEGILAGNDHKWFSDV